MDKEKKCSFFYDQTKKVFHAFNDHHRCVYASIVDWFQQPSYLSG